MKITHLFGILIISCFVGENLSTSTPCQKVGNEFVDPKSRVSCYFINIFDILKDRPQAGLADITITLEKYFGKHLDEACKAVLTAFENVFIPGKQPQISKKEISDQQQLASMASIRGFYLWSLLLEDFKKHYAAKPLLSVELIKKIIAKHKADNKVEFIKFMNDQLTGVEKPGMETFGRVLFLIHKIYKEKAEEQAGGVIMWVENFLYKFKGIDLDVEMDMMSAIGELMKYVQLGANGGITYQ